VEFGIIGAGRLGGALAARLAGTEHDPTTKPGHGTRAVATIAPFAEALTTGRLAGDGPLAPSVSLRGDDAKELVESLATDLASHGVDLGSFASSRPVEPALMLLVSIAYAGLPRDVGRRLLDRRDPFAPDDQKET
jgi:predicted dinucleotide-binding enzyme